jgi:predicted nucleotidyltransferase component of viral defense system
LYPENINCKNNIFYKVEKNLKWENNLFIEEIEGSENLSSEEFEDIILDKIIFLKKKWIKIDNIDVSQILEKETKLQKEWKIKINNTQKNIHKTLSDNYPILSVGRIKENHNVVNIRFWWIKKNKW